MTCENCTHAVAKPHWPGYTAACRGCTVRALANSPAFFTATQAAAMTPSYRSALQSLFGEEWQDAHQEVKAEAERLKKLRTP